MRRVIGRRLLRSLVARAVPLSDACVDAPAIVLAPHPDDETLGCGGLIARKRRRGVPVTVVFVTDGAASHAASRAELVARRRREALAACATLGVAEADVHFLDIPDGQLERALDGATARLAPILDREPHRQLIVPHPAEPPADHAATFRLADECLRSRGRVAEAVTYPVWLWDQWPFTNPLSAPRGRSSRRAIVRTALRHRLGFAVGRQLGHRLDISDVLDVKRAALDAHASQMRRVPGDESWLTLADVAGGAWLSLLLQPTELYGIAPLGARSGTERRVLPEAS